VKRKHSCGDGGQYGIGSPRINFIAGMSGALDGWADIFPGDCNHRGSEFEVRSDEFESNPLFERQLTTDVQFTSFIPRSESSHECAGLELQTDPVMHDMIPSVGMRFFAAHGGVERMLGACAPILPPLYTCS
jgi:hypothetical protein